MTCETSSRAAPLACVLPPLRQKRRLEQVAPLLARVTAHTRVAGGYALHFGDSGVLAPRASVQLIRELGEFVAFERRCCPFVDFRLDVAAGGGPVVLTLTGSREAQPILDEFVKLQSATTTQPARGWTHSVPKALAWAGVTGVLLSLCCVAPWLGLALAALGGLGWLDLGGWASLAVAILLLGWMGYRRLARRLPTGR